MDSIFLYIKESYNELMTKVTWPSWADLQNHTIVVLIASIIITLVVFLMDGASNFILDLIYPQ